MDKQRIHEIAEAAFKAHFSDIDIVSINIKPDYNYHDDEPLVIVKIIYDAKVEKLLAQESPNTIDVRSEIIDKLWNVKDSPGWPQVHFIAKSGRRHRPAKRIDRSE